MNGQLQDLIARTDERFTQAFGRRAEVVAAAPGRVNLIGEHVDYNDGFVLPAAIERWTVVAAACRPDRTVQLRSMALGGTAAARTDEPVRPAEPRGANYVWGVLAGFQSRGASVPGFDAVLETTVPVGGGLSSSAALEVATATLLEHLTGQVLSGEDKALLCQRAEHEYAGVPCGIMDQYASVFGRSDHLLLLDCRSRHIEYVPLTDPALSLLVIDTRVHHDLVEGEYANRRAACRTAAAALGVASLRDVSPDDLQRWQGDLTEETRRCARHVVTEIARTTEAARALAAGDWPQVAELMYASHASLRDDYRVSCPELDYVVDTARKLEGVLGCRMTGGGFGGCAVALVRTEATERVMRDVASAYTRHTGREPALFVTRPADGARVVRVEG